MTSEYKSAKLHYEARTRAEALAAALTGMVTVGEAYLPYDAPNGPCHKRLSVAKAALSSAGAENVETCGDCMGSGYSGHPDSGQVCYACKGSGGVASSGAGQEAEGEPVAFRQYQRKQIAELRPYAEGEDMAGISVSDADKQAGSPKPGDMIARNPKNHADQWLVAAQYFADNFAPITHPIPAQPQEVAVKALEWKKIHQRRSDEDPTTEWSGGFEADSALGFYEIGMGFGSDAYYWSVTAPNGDDVGSDFEDPADAKAAAQVDCERRIRSALSAPAGGAKPADAEEIR